MGRVDALDVLLNEAPAVSRNGRPAPVILIDPDDRPLLLAGEDPPSLGPGLFWSLPGGGLDVSDDVAMAARRGIREESGVLFADLGACVWTRHLPLSATGAILPSDEHAPVARDAEAEAVLDVQTDAAERACHGSRRSWSLDEMGSCRARFLPPRSPYLLRLVFQSGLPDAPVRMV